MIRSIKSLLLYIGFLSMLEANSLSNSYPSYSYVFNEFDIDKSYIHDDDFIDFVRKHEKNLKLFYKNSLKRGKDILPTIKGLLVGDGVSDLFIYLSMIESGFSTKAVSPKKAVGLWQFMPATAKHYNLKVCKDYDERCDTTASTTAAIAYLNKLHKQFGKWYLAAMAYNCGEGCMERAIKKAGTNKLHVLTNNRLKYLPKETREYIKKIILVAMIGENNMLGLGSSMSDSSKDTLTKVEVSGGADLQKIALLLKMDYDDLKKLNKKFKSSIVPNVRTSIMIPIDKIFAFYLRYELNEEIKPYLLSHYVVLGETLESIAKLYKTRVEEIRKVNNLIDSYLTLDQLLVIPVSKNIFENALNK